MNQYKMTLDLDKSPSANAIAYLRVGEKSGCQIRATILDHGTSLTTTGLSAYLVIAYPNGRYRTSATYSSGTVTITLPADAAGQVGRTDEAFFELCQGQTVIASTSTFQVVTLPGV